MMMPVSSLISGQHVRQMTVQNCFLNPAHASLKFISWPASHLLHNMSIIQDVSSYPASFPTLHKTSKHSVSQVSFVRQSSPWNMLVLIMRWDCRAILSACQAWPFALNLPFLGYCQISISQAPPVTLTCYAVFSTFSYSKALFPMITSYELLWSLKVSFWLPTAVLELSQQRCWCCLLTPMSIHTLLPLAPVTLVSAVCQGPGSS